MKQELIVSEKMTDIKEGEKCPIVCLDELFKNKDVKYFDLNVLLDVLKYLGFGRLDVDGQYHIIRVIDNIVEMSDTTIVVDVFEDFIKHPPKDVKVGNIEKKDILSKVYKSLKTRFSIDFLKRLRFDKPLEFFKDTKNEAYFYYKNGLVRVTKDEVKLLPYNILKGKYLWKSHILNREIELLAPEDYFNSPFAQFVSNISGNVADKKGKRTNPSRFKALRCIAGYNLHGYFQTKLKATIFTDSKVSDDPDGRTGKTLFAKALGKMLNVEDTANSYAEINGKNFRFDDKFRYQECGLNTRLVHLNDVARNFEFENLFNDITEGIKSEHKSRPPFLVMAKIIISTNRTIKIKGGSSKDRCIEFEAADYYSPDKSPEDEFKHRFFRDWDKRGWAMFDNFLLHCVQEYLQDGLKEPAQINLNQRKLIEETNGEFLSYMDEKILPSCSGEKWEKKELYETFIRQFPNDFRWLKQRTFITWCKAYVDYSSKWGNFKKEHESRTNGKSWITFYLKKV